MLISEIFATLSSKQSRHGVELREINNERKKPGLETHQLRQIRRLYLGVPVAKAIRAAELRIRAATRVGAADVVRAATAVANEGVAGRAGGRN